jgi:hypothetical protein
VCYRNCSKYDLPKVIELNSKGHKRERERERERGHLFILIKKIYETKNLMCHVLHHLPAPNQ